MPELPEVETIRRDLEKTILHKTFRRVEVADPFVLRMPVKDFIAGLKGQSIKAVIRRGKALIITCSNVMPECSHRASRSSGSLIKTFGDDKIHLVIQLMMTGQVIIGAKPDKHTRVIFEFTDGSCILYNDQRRFGQLRIIKSFSEVNYFNILGPEPLGKDFDAQYIIDHVSKSKRPIKTLLLDHRFVAGIGNIYACEILFRCGINPAKPAGRINRLQAQMVHQRIVEVLKEAIKHRGSSIRNYRDTAGQEGAFKRRIQVYARQKEPCYICQKPIARIIQAGRSTFFCPQCQK